jgi:predicted Zn-dependent protease
MTTPLITLRQSRPRWMGIILLALTLAVGSFGVASLIRPTAPVPVPAPQPAAIVLPDGPAAPAGVAGARPIDTIDRAIGVWTGNLQRDASDFIAATNLAQLYLARGRITGAGDDYQRALAAADSAQTLLPANAAVRVLHAQVQLGLHDFAGAADVARAVLIEQPDLPAALAVLGDASLELGDYAAASDAYARLGSASDGPAVTAREARLTAITGSIDDARQLAVAAATAADGDPNLQPADQAWYHILVGTLAFQSGDLPAARDAYQAGLAIWPEGPALLAGLGRAQAALGDRTAAIASYEAATRLLPLPEWLAAVGDLDTLAGRPADADAAFAQVRAIGALDAAGARLYSRGVILFLANHGETPGAAVTTAAADLARRHDIYAWDAYAWALYAAGRYDEAAAASVHARALGTQDAVLDYHAGMIAAASGDTDAARRMLSAALARNPRFDPLQAARARATLLELGRVR